MLTDEVQDVLRVYRRQSPVTLLATFAGNQSGGALASESRHQSLAQAQGIGRRGLGHPTLNNSL